MFNLFFNLKLINKNDDYVIRNEIKIDIPDDLKQILNEDYEHICINNKVARK